MSFEYCFAYEDRAQAHTSRWSLEGVSTASDGNIRGGRLWMTASESAGTVTVNLYKHADLASGDKVASGTADISSISAGAARCDLSEENSSGLSGEFYFESYSADVDSAELIVSLCDDSDLAVAHADLANLPVYDSGVGMALHCEVATRKVLLLISQVYGEELGGSGAPEHRYRAGASRAVPDFRRLANVDQLKDAAVHWALAMAFGACHERAEETMYSQLRDYHDQRRAEAVDAWNLTFNSNPDTDADADMQKSSGMVRVTRL